MKWFTRLTIKEFDKKLPSIDRKRTEMYNRGVIPKDEWNNPTLIALIILCLRNKKQRS